MFDFDNDKMGNTKKDYKDTQIRLQFTQGKFTKNRLQPLFAPDMPRLKLTKQQHCAYDITAQTGPVL